MRNRNKGTIEGIIGFLSRAINWVPCQKYLITKVPANIMVLYATVIPEF